MACLPFDFHNVKLVPLNMRLDLNLNIDFSVQMGNPCCHLPYEFQKICQCGGLKPLSRQISLHTTTILFHRLELSVGREHQRRRKGLEVGLLKLVNCAVN